MAARFGAGPALSSGARRVGSRSGCPPRLVWLAYGSLPAVHRVVGSGSRGDCHARSSAALPACLIGLSEGEAAVAKVVIGVDPHMRLDAVVVLNARGKVLARKQFANSAEGFRELRSLAR